MNEESLVKFCQGYLSAAFWACKDDEGNSLENNFSADDLSRSTQETIVEECHSFLHDNLLYLEGRYTDAGADFFYSRNKFDGRGFQAKERFWRNGDSLNKYAVVCGESWLSLNKNNEIVSSLK